MIKTPLPSASASRNAQQKVIRSARTAIRRSYFLPLFLIPPPPRGPFPEAFFAISSRAFLSAS